ncbi:family 16 glycoside hydrolase [Candidatus Poribacteria bacterium]
MCRNRYVSAMIVHAFLITVLMGVSQVQALLYNFENPNQLDDFVVDEGDWEIKDGILEGKLPAGEYLGVYLNYPGSEGWGDYVVEVEGTWLEDLGAGGQSAQLEIYFRYKDKQNRYFLDANYFLNDSGLYAQVAGGWPDLGGGRKPVEGIPDEQTHLYRIELEGESIRVYVDENMIFDVTDANFSEGTIGLGGYGSRVQFDNLKIEGDAIPASAVEAQGKLATSWGNLKSHYVPD